MDIQVALRELSNDPLAIDWPFEDYKPFFLFDKEITLAHLVIGT